jgi:N4-gp56 family major capsid protein
MANEYNDPKGGTKSTIGSQFRTDKYNKSALVDARRKQFFGQMSSVENMPKHMGKDIKRYHYIPMLDERNVNDQGIDASGVTISSSTWTAYNNAGAEIGATYTTEALALAATGAVSAQRNGGNMYGGSKDIGAMVGKFPALTENGGRVNRVGHTRVDLTGSITKFGFFFDYTQESLDFDTDDQLMQHLTTESVNGAVEITEDMLQIDIVNSAGTIVYPGAATSLLTVSGQSAVPDVLDYPTLMRLKITLDQNRTPQETKVITGTRMTDTLTIRGGRFIHCGTEMIPTLERMVDHFNKQAFQSVEKYAAGTTVMEGEIGAIGNFRFIIVPEMTSWAGRGAAASEANQVTHHTTNGFYDVIPLLCIGSESFVTIGFQTTGKGAKFTTIHKPPGKETADHTDPYGETGFMSMKWYYGFMALRPERIALIRCAAYS